MKRQLKNHKCLYCEHIGYWDWYFCRSRRKFYIWDYGVNEILLVIRRIIESLVLGEMGQWHLLEFFKYELTKFLPQKAVRKCSFYTKSDRDHYWLYPDEVRESEKKWKK